MKRYLLTRGLVGISALSLGALVATFASCAATDTNTTDTTDASGSPPTERDAGGDALVDAGCEPTDPECVTQIVPCEEVEWCSTPTSLSPYHLLNAVWGSSATDVWAVGSGGTILHYDGATWAATPTGVKNTFYSVWGSGPNDIYTVSSTQVILHSTGFANGSATWTLIPTDVEPAAGAWARGLWGSSANDVRIGSRAYDYEDPVTGDNLTGNQFTKYVDEEGQVRWQSHPGNAYIYGIWGSSADDVWMIADNSVYVSYQRALTLHGTVGDAGGPPDGGYAPGTEPDRLTWTPVDSQANVPLEGIWGSSAADVWTVGTLGTIRHITPADVRWQKVESPTTVTLHSIWGSGPNDIWAVGDAGTILHNDGSGFKPSSAQFNLGKKPDLRGVWGSAANDVWIVGDGIVFHYTGKKGGS